MFLVNNNVTRVEKIEVVLKTESMAVMQVYILWFGSVCCALVG